MVEEVSEDGDVPNLAVTNRGDRPILITEGEILVGAKQNRVVNITVLVAASRRFAIPVSCVEQGRWEQRGQRVQAEYAAPPSLRSKKLQAVQRNRNRGDQPRSDQAQVWADVDACLASMGVESETASLTDAYVEAEEELLKWRDRFPLSEDASGLIVTRGGRIVGMDLFDSAATFGHLKDRLLDAYLLDSLQDGQPSRNTGLEPRQFLGRVATSVRPRSPTLGEGIELEIEGAGLVGSALLYEDQICHLAAFSEAS